MRKLNRIARAAVIASALTLLGAGCSKQEISSYEAPKESYAPKVSAMASAPGRAAAESMPHVHWELPTGWEEKPGNRFRVAGEEDRFAEVRIVPLKSLAGMEGQVVNMWREELGLAPGPTNGVKGASVEIGGGAGEMFDLVGAGTNFLGKYKGRTTAAVLERDGLMWFVKMSGEDSVVGREQAAFKGFLKSLTFHDEPHGDEVASARPAAEAHNHHEGEHEPHPETWDAPAGWKKVPPGTMVLAAYQAANGAADVSVSVFPGDVGGMLANVNRWRGQMGVAPISAGDLAKEVKTIELASGEKASAVEIEGTVAKTGKPGRLYALVMTRGSKSWFFRMTGDPAAVTAEKENLAKFAAGAH